MQYLSAMLGFAGKEISLHSDNSVRIVTHRFTPVSRASPLLMLIECFHFVHNVVDPRWTHYWEIIAPISCLLTVNWLISSELLQA